MRILWDNEIDKNTLSFGSVQSAYPVGNIQDYQLAKKWRSEAIATLIDRGDCESATAPMIFDETVPTLVNATFAIDATEQHAGANSYKITKTIAAGTAASVDLVDDTATDDMHGLKISNTYTYNLWVYIDTGQMALNEISIGIRDYEGSWEETTSANPTQFDTWQKLTVTRTIRPAATGAVLRINVASTAADTEFCYVDDIDTYKWEWIIVDAGVGNTITATSAVILSHNLSASGTYKIQGNNTADWTSPTVDETITHDTDMMIKYFTSASHRFWRFLIYDVTNTDGYNEMGRLSLGTYLQTNTLNKSFNITYEDTSSSAQSLRGQTFGDERIIRRSYDCSFSQWSDTLRKSFITMFEYIKKVKPVILIADENNTDKVVPVYCKIDDDMDINNISSYVWSSSITFKEVF